MVTHEKGNQQTQRCARLLSFPCVSSFRAGYPFSDGPIDPNFHVSEEITVLVAKQFVSALCIYTTLRRFCLFLIELTVSFEIGTQWDIS